MEELVLREQELYDRSDLVYSQESYNAWEKKCEECIELLEESNRNKRMRLSVGYRQSIIARIARLEGLKNVLRTRFMHVGAGHSSLIWREIETAFESRLSTGAIINTNYIEPRRFLEDAKNVVLQHVRNTIDRHVSVKVNTAFNGEFVAGDKRASKTIQTKNFQLFATSDLNEWFEERVIKPTLAQLEEFQERDSGWALSRIQNLLVNLNKYNPLRAGCHIDLPREIQLKRAVVNVKSADNACFAWAVVAALYPADRDAERSSKYPHYASVLNLQGIEFPMTLNQIKRFEQLNQTISVNVYTIQKNEKATTIVPIRLAGEKREKHVNMLYLEDPRDQNVGHFAWIKNLSRLVSSQINNKDHAKYICDR